MTALTTVSGRFLTDFQFLKDFLENEVSQKYSVEWKRAAFFEFMTLWRLPELDNGSGEEFSRLTQDL